MERQGSAIQIGIAALLMLAGIYTIGNNLLADRSGATVLPSAEFERPVLYQEAGMFSDSRAALAALQTEQSVPSTRTLNEFYSRRAYPGAPPFIPHKLLDARGIGARSCNACHATGGWAPAFNAYTPVTPHPELESCLSCHVPGQEKPALFAESTFIPATRPEIAAAPLPLGPPPVPHPLEMRANCQACHAGPGAVKEIRTPHPERQNCRQCHVSPATDDIFQRPQ